MPLFHTPSPRTLDEFRAAQSALDLTYPAVGATAATPRRNTTRTGGDMSSVIPVLRLPSAKVSPAPGPEVAVAGCH
jgi:hypothetical protein